MQGRAVSGMARPRRIINIEDQFGWLTVLGEAPKDKTGHIRYRVRCACGNEFEILTGNLTHGNPKCLSCSRSFRSTAPHTVNPGDELNGWRVLREVGKNKSGAILYLCRCLSCGNTSIRTQGALALSKTGRCCKCPPMYNFDIRGDVAAGILPDGSRFLIDADMVPLISSMFWSVNSKGYIKRNQRNAPKPMLHWYILGFLSAPGNGICIDHINRDKLDCRRENLRVVSHQQNSMNRSIGRNNTSGYVGVCFVKSRNRYSAKISLNDRNINLGYSKDPVVCAQMYNTAASLLFRDYTGHHNDVPEAPLAIRERIEEKCKEYTSESVMATQSCGLFLCERKEAI